MRRFLVASPMLCVAWACSDSPEKNAPDAAPAMVDAMIDTPAPCGTSTYQGVVRAFDPALPYAQWPRLAGVSVCDALRPSLSCATTGLDGSYTLSCVPTGEAALSFTKQGYVALVRYVLALGTGVTSDASLLTEQQQLDFYAPVGVEFPKAGYGAVALNDVTHQDGITMSAAGAMGPYYSGDGITIDTNATGTVGDGMVFFIAPIGQLTIEITPTVSSQLCGHALGAFGSTGSGLTIPIYEHTENSAYVACR